MGVTELNETKRNEWKNNNRASQRPSPTRTLQYKNKCKDRYSKKKLKSTCPSQQYSDTPLPSHARPVTIWWAADIKKIRPFERSISMQPRLMKAKWTVRAWAKCRVLSFFLIPSRNRNTGVILPFLFHRPDQVWVQWAPWMVNRG